jgi:hypothetical protein
MYIKQREVNGLACQCSNRPPQQLSGIWTRFGKYVWNSMTSNNPKILQGEKGNAMNVTAGVER